MPFISFNILQKCRAKTILLSQTGRFCIFFIHFFVAGPYTEQQWSCSWGNCAGKIFVQFGALSVGVLGCTHKAPITVECTLIAGIDYFLLVSNRTFLRISLLILSNYGCIKPLASPSLGGSLLLLLSLWGINNRFQLLSPSQGQVLTWYSPYSNFQLTSS